jgi:hypothetical protein
VPTRRQRQWYARSLFVWAGLSGGAYASSDPVDAAQPVPEGVTVEVIPEGDPNAGVQILRGLPEAAPVEDPEPRTGSELANAARSGTLTRAELSLLAERSDLDAARLRAAHYSLAGDDRGLVSALEAWHRAAPDDPEPPFKIALLSQTLGDTDAALTWADRALQQSARFPADVRERQTLMLCAIAARAADTRGDPARARTYAKQYVSVALAEKSRVPEDIRQLALDDHLKVPND